jgi:hypothetical protein
MINNNCLKKLQIIHQIKSKKKASEIFFVVDQQIENISENEYI